MYSPQNKNQLGKKINLPKLDNKTSILGSKQNTMNMTSDRSLGSAHSSYRKRALGSKLANADQKSNNEDLLVIEDYDHQTDKVFILEYLTPYFKDLYKDLLMRSANPSHIDKVTFIEYTKLPGIINDRLHQMF